MPGNTNQTNRAGKQPANKPKGSKVSGAKAPYKASKPQAKDSKDSKPVSICRYFRYFNNCKNGASCRYVHAMRTRHELQDGNLPDQTVPNQFLSLFPGYDLQRASLSGFHAEYRLLRGKQEGRLTDEEKAVVDADYDDMLVEFGNLEYGEDAEDLRAWKALCRQAGLDEPFTVAEAHKIVRAACIDLVTVLDWAHAWRGVAPKCGSIKEKREQMTARGAKEFPRNHPQAGDFLKKVLELQVGGAAAPRLSREEAAVARKAKKAAMVEEAKMKKVIKKGSDGTISWGWVPIEEEKKKKSKSLWTKERGRRYGMIGL